MITAMRTQFSLATAMSQSIAADNRLGKVVAEPAVPSHGASIRYVCGFTGLIFSALKRRAFSVMANSTGSRSMLEAP